MNSEKLNKAQILIRESKALSAVEKAEWAQLLSEMSDAQIDELMKILVSKNKITTPSQWHPPVNIQQKELKTSIPEHELELSAPKKEIPIQKPELKTEPKPATAPASPDSLRRTVDQIVKDLQTKKSMQPLPPVAHDTPKPTAAPKSIDELLKHEIPQPKTVEHKEVPEDLEIVLARPQDFSNLTPAILHSSEPAETLEDILKAITVISKRFKIGDILTNLQDSELYKAYVNTGIEMLNHVDGEHAQVVQSLKQKGLGYLNHDEFEAFTDFRHKLDKLYL